MSTVQISRDASRRIARMGLVCAMLVVFIHSYQFLALNGKDSVFATVLEELVSENIALIAVPFFFLVSGFFLYRDYEFSWAWFLSKLRSRIVSLAVPYVLWGIIAMAFTVCCSLVAEKLHEAPMDYTSIRWWLQVLGVTQKPLYCGQLWFVRMILEWLCLAPFVGWLIRRFGFWVPALCLVIQCVPILANPWAHALLFISMGASLALASEPTRATLDKALARPVMVCALIGIWLALMFLRIGLSLTYGGDPSLWRCVVCGVPIPYDLVMKSIGIAAVWILFGWMRNARIWNVMDHLLGAAFFIYCTHLMFLALFRSPLRRLPFIWGNDLLRYLLPPILAIVVGLVVWKVLGRILPALMRILCGGRG